MDVVSLHCLTQVSGATLHYQARLCSLAYCTTRVSGADFSADALPGLSLGHGNHECDSGHGDGDADDNVGGKRFAKHECTYENGCYGFEHSQYGGFGGADVPGGYGEGRGGYYGRQ